MGRCWAKAEERRIKEANAMVGTVGWGRRVGSGRLGAVCVAGASSPLNCEFWKDRDGQVRFQGSEDGREASGATIFLP